MDQKDKNSLPVSRRGVLLGGAGLVGAGLVPAQVRAQAQGSVAAADLPRGSEYILRAGMVVTLDPSLGDLTDADVHVKDGAIVAIGQNLSAPGVEVVDAGNMILMPGMVETHWHMWNTLFKTMTRVGRSYVDMKNNLGKHHTPEDYYNANRLALTEAIDAGITTVINYAHNTRTPEHVNEEIRAMVESGLRGRYAYGGEDHPVPTEDALNIEDALRANREFFTGTHEWTGRVDFGFAHRGPGGLPESHRKEFRAAMDAGLPLIMHTGQSSRTYIPPRPLYEQGLVNGRTIFVHSLCYTKEDWELLKEIGASNSISLWNEFPHGQRDARAAIRPQMLQQIHHGVNVCLSFDGSSLSPTSMFEQMRLCYAVLMGEAETPTAELARVTHTQCLEMATINGARAMGYADKFGTLTPGKRADIILVKADDLNMAPLVEPHTALVHTANNRNVDTVIVDGRFLKRGGKILSVDVEEVRTRAIQSLHNIRTRAGGDFAPASDTVPRF